MCNNSKSSPEQFSPPHFYLPKIVQNCGRITNIKKESFTAGEQTTEIFSHPSLPALRRSWV
eukprot:TRINITY_DN9002_c0_g1_i1.p1 TRINITY_DN9002_c0_g1~~TRINITY_DN9002_c0_g1_i1.p1  ORF type:complete len:61 (+),score=3.83 TRINITY_DN9002_c0_g1_i1:91-273(+)